MLLLMWFFLLCILLNFRKEVYFMHIFCYFYIPKIKLIQWKRLIMLYVLSFLILTSIQSGLKLFQLLWFMFHVESTKKKIHWGSWNVSMVKEFLYKSMIIHTLNVVYSVPGCLEFKGLISGLLYYFSMTCINQLWFQTQEINQSQIQVSKFCDLFQNIL